LKDSGFSDNDESHSTRSLGGHSSSLATASPSAKSDISSRSVPTSPSSISQRTIETPPTVIRRVGKSQFYSPVVNVSRRISFSGTPTKSETATTTTSSLNMEDATTTNSCGRAKPKQLNFDEKHSNELAFKPKDNVNIKDKHEYQEVMKSSKKLRRRKRVVRTATKPLSPTRRRSLFDNKFESDDDDDNDDDDDDDDDAD